MTRALTPGTQLGRYVVDGLLGRGGGGAVYAARLKGAGGIERRVALKVLHDEESPPQPSSTRRASWQASIINTSSASSTSTSPPTKASISRSS